MPFFALFYAIVIVKSYNRIIDKFEIKLITRSSPGFEGLKTRIRLPDSRKFKKAEKVHKLDHLKVKSCNFKEIDDSSL